MKGAVRGLLALGAGLVLMSGAQAQDCPSMSETSSGAWQRYDWLKSPEEQQRAAASGTVWSATTGQDLKDPSAVLSTGSLWQEKSSALYTRRLADTLTLTCESDTVTWNNGSVDLWHGQTAGLQFQPASGLTFRGNFHDSTTAASLPGNEVVTSGAGFSAQGHLPWDTVLNVGVNSDRSEAAANATPTTTNATYDAQLQKPLGKLPLTAQLKGHYENIHVDGESASGLPSLEQSLVWKPMQETTLQAGLRQQHYQVFPGDRNDFNETLFADFSQKVMGDITWHSYAELLSTRTTEDTAPVVPIASGANGTAQANASPGSSPLAMPTLQDSSVTFSTGPTFKLEKDISASLEYSNRWDAPAAGSVGQEQRISISVKGSF